ncbi:MAG: GGDEF domain-containing protein [Betaproteobacteria bacterium]
MARFIVFPRDDPEQTSRIRRYLIASGTSLMFVGLMGLSVLCGVLNLRSFVIATTAVLAAISVFYVLFRTGVNRKARDRTLTIPMMCCAVCVVTYVLYQVGSARGAFLLMYPVILFPGVFRFNTRTLLHMSVFMMAGYGLVIALLMYEHALGRPQVELLQWLVLNTVLVWFSYMGGYVNDLRRRVRQSEYDELTRAYTRRRIFEILSHEKTRADRGAGALAICMMDIDLFKRVNDGLGHHAGDEVLKSFVNVAQGELRAIDFIGRHGGDEFLLVLTQTSLQGALECAERVRQRTELLTMTPSGHPFAITVSIGVAHYRPGEALSDTIQRADEALYRAKSQGRNRVESEPL